jgi:protein Mpv17
MFRGFGRWVNKWTDSYTSLLTRRPFTVQMTTTAILTAAGDISAQVLEHRWDQQKKRAAWVSSSSSSHLSSSRSTTAVTTHSNSTTNDTDAKYTPEPFKVNLRRLAAMTGVGAFIVGPAGHIWYMRLEQFIRTRLPHLIPGSVPFLATKVALDCGLFGPAYLACMFTTVGLLEGEGKKEIMARFNESYASSIAMDWVYWPPIQAMNFKFVPVHHQLLVMITTHMTIMNVNDVCHCVYACVHQQQ